MRISFVKDVWRILAYGLLVGFLPLAFWYALWPHRRKLEKKAAETPVLTENL
jgi:hypothetical protein